MDKKELKEILKKCFGKEKDTRYHAIAMLIIYGIFMLFLIALIRIGGNTSNTLSDDNSSNTINQTPKIVEPNSDNNTSANNNDVEEVNISNDINYTYSYNINFDGSTEIYLGKRIDDKQKFSYIKDGVTLEYAIINGNYLILQDGSYHITSKLDTYFKYCDINKLINLTQDELSYENGNTVKYNIKNSILAKAFNDTLINLGNTSVNSIQFVITDNVLKSAYLDLSNYISAVLDGSHSLIINMEFVDVGTTEDFNINVS